ncbi:MAG: ribonuclease P protein component [Clostridia bacterium]|nr:ribonuclease P protein component [Clostridia bacterium]
MINTVSLKRGSDIVRTFRHGKYKAGRYLTVYARPNRLPYNRLAVSQVKHFGNSVERNRAKRLSRENYSHLEKWLITGMDIVIVARACNPKPDYYMINSELKYLLSRLELFTKDSTGESIIPSDDPVLPGASV